LPKVARLRDGEITFERRGRFEERPKKSLYDARGLLAKSKQHHASGRILAAVEHLLSEVGIERQDDSGFLNGDAKQFHIRLCRVGLRRMNDVVATLSKPSHDFGRNILIGKEPVAHGDGANGGSRWNRSSRSVWAA